MATKETPKIPMSAVELAEKIDSKNAKELTAFIIEMDDKDTTELKNILKAIGLTVQRKQPLMARYNWTLGNIMSEKSVLDAGIDVDNCPDIRTQTKQVLKNGEIVDATVYYNAHGLKHIKSNFLKNRIENASAEISTAIQEFTEFLPVFAKIEAQWNEAAAATPKPSNFGTLAAGFADAEAKYNNLRKSAGFTDEQLRNVETIAKKEHLAEVLAVQSQLDRVKSHVMMNNAKKTALNHIINGRESRRLTAEVATADAQKIPVMAE
jgi:hypothetical protein